MDIYNIYFTYQIDNYTIQYRYFLGPHAVMQHAVPTHHTALPVLALETASHQYYEKKVRKDFTITEKAPIIVCYGCQRGADNNLCNILIDCL